MTISLKDVNELRLDLRKNVDPFDIRGEEEGAGGCCTELRLGMQGVQLFNGTVSFVIRNEMAVLSKNIP